MADQDLVVLQVHHLLGARFKGFLRCFHGGCVFKPCITLKHHGGFLRPALAVRFRFLEEILAFPERLVTGKRPELVGEPNSFGDMKKKVRKHNG